MIHGVSKSWTQLSNWTELRLLCPWDSPGKNTGVDCHFLLQRIFLTQELSPSLLHHRQILYWLNYVTDKYHLVPFYSYGPFLFLSKENLKYHHRRYKTQVTVWSIEVFYQYFCIISLCVYREDTRCIKEGKDLELVSLMFE